MFISAMVAFAIWTRLNSVCIELVRESGTRCVDGPAMVPGDWREAVITTLAIDAVLVALIVPFVVGLHANRGYWWHLAAISLSSGILAGVGLGIWLAEREDHGQYWSNPVLWTHLQIAALTSVVVIWTTGLILLRRQMRDPSKWRLSRVFPDSERGHSTQIPRVPGRHRMVEEFDELARCVPPRVS